MAGLGETRIVVAGDALVDLIIGQDGSVNPLPGGGQYNAARTIARLGGDAHFLGRISDDWFGSMLRRGLEADGVGTGLIVETGDPTTLALAEIDAAGVSHYHWHIQETTVPGLETADALLALEPPPGALHVGTLGLALEPVADSLAALVAQVPAETFVMVDPNCRPAAIADFDRYQARMRRILERADVIKGSDEDFEYLRLAPTPEASARLLLEGGAGAVLLTQGSDVARGFCAGGEIEVPVPVVEVSDTVGAGDAFGGAFLAMWLEWGYGRDDLADAAKLRQAVEFAVRAAAINCVRVGAEPPTRADMGLR